MAFSTQGLATGISYELDGISTDGSNLGKEYSFEGLQNLGVDYNSEWDNQLIETIVDYSFEGRILDDSYIEQLRRFRQTKQLEAQRMKQVFQVLGKSATWTGISIYRIVEGLVVEERGEEDILGALQQLGLIPTFVQTEG